MVALAVVLGDELPVRVDLVGRGARRAQRGQVEPGEVIDEVAQLVLQRRALLGQVANRNPSHVREADRPQPVRAEVELGEVVRVLGPDEVALEVVDPGVVRALEADDRAARLLRDGRAPMLADVVEGADDAVAAAHDDQRLVVDRGQDVRAGCRHVLVAPDDLPVATEEPLPLERVERRVVVRPAGQQRAARYGRRTAAISASVRSPVAASLVRHALGMSFFASRNGIAAVRAGPARPSGFVDLERVPGAASSIGTQT